MVDETKENYCPHCNQKLTKWKVPVQSTWSTEFFYVCFNDDCPYYKKGWDVIQKSVNAHASYRYHLNPDSGKGGPLPVWSDNAMKESIVEE